VEVKKKLSMTPDDKKRTIGKIINVSADKLIIELHGGTDSFTVVGFDDIHYVARLGSFLMIPVHAEYVVTEIVGLWERDPITKKDQDRGQSMDKASSAKFLDVVPVGVLPRDGKGKFRFGVSTYPSLYADALYAVDQELDRIFDVESAEELVPNVEQPEGTPQELENHSLSKPTRYKAISFGNSVVFHGYDVKVRLEEFFGGHAAVLGNTGSGKSCTVATILQSLFEKPNEYKARGSTFVIFDVNGEYYNAFAELKTKSGINVKELILDGTSDEGKFRLPHWFLDQSEWELLLQASERTQIPVLRTALGLTSFLQKTKENEEVREHFLSKCLWECYQGASGDSTLSKKQRIITLLDKYGTTSLNRSICNFNKFGDFDTDQAREAFLTAIKHKIKDDIKLPSYVGNSFNFSDLIECIEFAILYEEAHGNRQIRDYCASMMTRLHSLSDRREFDFLKSETELALSKDDFLREILGISRESNLENQDQLIIINMNSVDDEVVELVSAVIARMVFWKLRRAEPRNSFPVHFILEEAHRYIAEKPSKYAVEASKIFERVAKEGRKYGVFLLVASQRPSELSRTVLSQCSNFVVHRIQNPEDLSHIRQMTPFISEAVLRRLPSLPKQHALVFGNAVNLPTTFKVRNADPVPLSHDTKIRELWFRKSDQPKILPSSDERTAGSLQDLTDNASVRVVG
jgi:Helicase HerA, central domain